MYRARDIITKKVVAVKLETATNGSFYLEHEYVILQVLQGSTGIPRLLWFGREGPYQAMVTDNLGPSLDDLLRGSTNCSLQLHVAASLGLQIVSPTSPVS